MSRNDQERPPHLEDLVKDATVSDLIKMLVATTLQMFAINSRADATPEEKERLEYEMKTFSAEIDRRIPGHKAEERSPIYRV